MAEARVRACCKERVTVYVPVPQGTRVRVEVRDRRGGLILSKTLETRAAGGYPGHAPSPGVPHRPPRWTEPQPV